MPKLTLASKKKRRTSPKKQKQLPKPHLMAYSGIAAALILFSLISQWPGAGSNDPFEVMKNSSLAGQLAGVWGPSFIFDNANLNVNIPAGASAYVRCPKNGTDILIPIPAFPANQAVVIYEFAGSELPEYMATRSWTSVWRGKTFYSPALRQAAPSLPANTLSQFSTNKWYYIFSNAVVNVSCPTPPVMPGA